MKKFESLKNEKFQNLSETHLNNINGGGVTYKIIAGEKFNDYIPTGSSGSSSGGGTTSGGGTSTSVSPRTGNDTNRVGSKILDMV